MYNYVLLVIILLQKKSEEIPKGVLDELYKSRQQNKKIEEELNSAKKDLIKMKAIETEAKTRSDELNNMQKSLTGASKVYLILL